ncbi:glycosyltransferase family 4 protein, partial [Chloroflexota bacterium]
ELKRLGDEVEVISLPSHSYPRHLLDNFSQELLTRITAVPFDVLLQDELNHPSLFLINRRLKRLVPTLLVAIVHHLRSSEVSRLNWFYRLIEGSYLKTLDGAIYNSPSTKESVESFRQLPGLVALPGGDHLTPDITVAMINRRSHQPGPLNVLFIGNIIPRKGLETLLKALARLPRENYSLTIAGDLETNIHYSQKIVQLSGVLGIEGNTTFLGYCSSHELSTLIKNGHLLVVPSQYEGFGIVYLEAMGFGIPPVASAAGGAGYLIRHGNNGFLLQTGDVQGLTDILQSVYRDRELLARLSLAAYHTYKDHPTWSCSGKSVRNFLRELQADTALSQTL